MRPEERPLGSDLHTLLLWAQSAVVSAALRLQVTARVQSVLQTVEDNRERARQEPRVMVRT